MDPVDHNRVRGPACADRGTVSYLHMHTLVEMHGQPGWVAALTRRHGSGLREDG